MDLVYCRVFGVFLAMFSTQKQNTDKFDWKRTFLNIFFSFSPDMENSYQKP